MSRPPARHQKPPRRSPARLVPYDGSVNEAPYDGNPYEGRYNDGPSAEFRYDDARHTKARHGDARFHDSRYAKARYHDGRYDESRYHGRPYSEPRHHDGRYGDASYDQYAEARYDDGRYLEPRYDDGPNDEAPYNEGQYDQARCDEGQHDEAPYAEAPYDETWHNESQYDEAAYDDGGYDRGVSDRRRPPSGRGAHRHARPSKARRKPVKIAAAMAGSTLLVAAAAPLAAHWWHRPGTHPTALDQENPASTPGAVLGAGPRIPGQPAAPENTLAQWAQIPVGKHAATQVSAARRAARRAAAQPSHAPSPQPKATPSAAYQNPLRAVSGLVLERIDMGVDFGGAGPVYALGDGVITNATGDSSGWPGGGWITYQLTDGPDSGLVVYLAEDVTPTVQVGQKVTSSTEIADMFNGGDGIETGWATSDSSTAESQMTAAGGISGGGPFPTMVGLSFDAVLESVGVPAAPNAGEAGSGLLPAGYPPVPS